RCVCRNGLAQCRQAVTGTKGPVVIARPGGLAIQKAVPDLARKQVDGRQRRREWDCSDRPVVTGVALQIACTPGWVTLLYRGAPCNNHRRAQQRQGIALGKTSDDKSPGATAAQDVAIRDQLAQRLINSVPRDSQVLREHAAGRQPGVRWQCAAGDGGPEPLAN